MEQHPVVAFVVLDKENHVVTDNVLLEELNINELIKTYVKVEHVNYSTETYEEAAADLTADYIHHMYVVHLKQETSSDKLLPNTLRLEYPYLEEQWYYKTIEANELYELIKYSLYLYDK